MYSPRLSRFIILTLILLLGWISSVKAFLQQDGLSDIKVSFLRDTVIQSGSALSFNRVTLTNQTSRRQVINLELDLPENWSSPFGTSKTLELEPQGIVEIPLRTAASNSTLSTVAYPITLKVSQAGSSQKILATYIARVEANSKWNATLVNPEVKIDRLSRITYFMVRLTNSGNVDEELSIDLRTSLELTIPKKNNLIKVRASRDTTIHIGLITDPRLLDAFKPQNIQLEIRDKKTGYRSLTQKLYSSNFIFRENASRWYDVPMYVELVSQNFTRPDQKQFYMNSAGSIALGQSRSINYTFRSDNYYTYNSEVSSRYANVDFETKKWKLSVGDQNEFSSFPIDGLGARIQHTTSKGYSVDLLGVNSRLGNARQFTLGQNLPLGKNSSIRNSSLVNLDRATSTNSYSTLSEFNSIVGRSTFQISAGYGAETIHRPAGDLSKMGPAAGFSYYYNSPSFVARSMNNFTSPNFAGLERGVKRSSSEVRVLAKNVFLGALADYNSRSVSLIDSLRMINLFGGRIGEFGLRSGFQKGSSNFTVTAYRVDQLQDSATNVPFRSDKLNLNAGLMLFSKINISLSANYIQSYPKGNATQAINAFNAYGSVQTKGMGLSFRLDHGPFYYSDLMQYLKLGTAANRYQISPYFEKALFKSALTTRAEVNYLKDVAYGTENLAARIDLNLDLKKRGMSVRFYGNHDFTSKSNADYMNLSIRKNLSIPLLGLRKFMDLKVVLFKDHNNNGIFDQGDSPIPDASLKIGGQNFTSSVSGEAVYKNISAGEYILELKQDDNVKGWIAKNGFRQTVKLDRSQTWYIPFKESRFLSGRINVVKDDYSKLTFNVASIRITALNSKGEIFSTLTNGNGEFFMNLPGDTYLLQINNNVFTEEFRVLEGSFNIDLSNENREDIVFEVREKKRQMNIRR
ncbi:MAG TPA: hypothetical protein VGD90_08070 [Sphingobacteriaceae bacterium]